VKTGPAGRNGGQIRREETAREGVGASELDGRLPARGLVTNGGKGKKNSTVVLYKTF